MTKLSPRVRVGYALGGITTGTYGTVPGLILMPFLTDHLGVAAALAGLIVFAPKAWDFFLNPIAGRISDQSKNPTDRRRPFVIRAGLLLAIVFVLLFWGPTHPPLIAGLWVLLISLVCATAYAFYQVPFLSMASEITDDYNERTHLLTWRVAVFSLLILVSGGLAPVLVDMGEGVSGYRLMAIVMAVLIAIGAAGVYFGTRGATLTRDEQAGGTLLQQLKIVLSNKDSALFLLACVLQAIGIGMVLAGVVYVAKNVVQTPLASTLAFVCFVAPAIIFAPIWRRVGVRIGKKSGFMVASLIATIGFLMLTTARTGQLTWLLVGASIVGLGYAGCQIFPLAVLPDITAEDARVSGLNRIGVFSGVYSGFELMGLALGPAIYGFILGLGGYQDSTTGAIEQTDAAKWAIVIGISIVPALFTAISLWPLSKYKLDGILRARAAEAAAGGNA